MGQQFKVVKLSPAHDFKIGEIVTRSADDSVEFQTFRAMATVLGVADTAVVKGAAPYTGADGANFILSGDEVEPV